MKLRLQFFSLFFECLNSLLCLLLLLIWEQNGDYFIAKQLYIFFLVYRTLCMNGFIPVGRSLVRMTLRTDAVKKDRWSHTGMNCHVLDCKLLLLFSFRIISIFLFLYNKLKRGTMYYNKKKMCFPCACLWLDVGGFVSCLMNEF